MYEVVKMMRGEVVKVELMKSSVDVNGVVLCGGRKDGKASAKLEIRAKRKKLQLQSCHVILQ